MIRILFPLMILMFAATSSAQTQQGFVRTAGTASKKGAPLSNVSIRSAGGSSVLSDGQGAFSIIVSGVGREGELFKITSVRKNGYELLDKDGLKNSFVYSTKVPIEIVMISTKELQNIKQDIEEQARRNAEKSYEKKLKALKQDLESQKVTLREYNAKINELEQQMESFESLIDAMAEHYARTDYDKLDSLNAAINQCIAEGRLEEADSLINTKGDVVVRAHENMRKGQQLTEAEAQLNEAKHRVQENNDALEEEGNRIRIWQRQRKQIKRDKR